MDLLSLREASTNQVQEARRGFDLLLRSKRMSPRWIEENAEEVFGQAQREYAEWLAKGREAENPPGWMIHCAWRRTQDRLDYESRHPREVSFEKIVHAADEATQTPEQLVLEGDRRSELLRAMSFLDPADRELLRLAYFDGLPIREAGRQLGWEKSSSDRHHKAALDRLRAMLEDKVDVPMLEVGTAAAAGAALERSSPSTVSLLASSIGDASTAALGRLEDLWRRLLPVSEPATANLAGTAARGAGVCGAAVLACLASGVIGPGVGGVAIGDQRPAEAEQVDGARAAPAARTPRPSADAAPLLPARPEPPSLVEQPSPKKKGARPGGKSQKPKKTASPARRQVQPATGPVTDQVIGLEEPSPSYSAGEGPTREPSSGGGGSQTQSGNSQPASGADVETEFGL